MTTKKQNTPPNISGWKESIRLKMTEDEIDQQLEFLRHEWQRDI